MTKQDLYRLVDELPESTQETAFHVLKCLRDEANGKLAQALAEDPNDPFLCALAAAPEDDEPETLEEVDAVREAKLASARGEVSSLDEVEQRLFPTNL